MTNAFEAVGLTKRFGATQALAGIDLAACEGTVLGVLGPNGAGKTTAVRILATLLRPDSGHATVAGYDIAHEQQKVRQNIGLTGQYASVDDDLTGMQNLVMIGQLLDLSSGDARRRAVELLEWFDLADAAGRQAKTYSGGMRRRLDLAASLVGRPRLGGGSRHDYLQFLLPGLLAQGIAMGSVALGQNLNADIEMGVFDRFRSLPIARSVPLVGAVLADFFRYLLVCVIFIGFGYVMGFRIGTNPPALLAAVGLSVAFALCFCWISVWIGMKARTSGSVQGIMFLLILPLSFGSNAYVPTDSMPGWLQAFVKINPISQLVGAVRGLMIDGPVAAHVGWTLTWMAGLLVVFVPLAMRAYRKCT